MVCKLTFVFLGMASWIAAAESSLAERMERVPMAFTASTDPNSPIRFTARGRGHAVELTDDAAFLVLEKATLPIRVRGASPQSRPVAGDRLPGKANFLIGNDPKQWRKNVDTFGKVTYRGLLPGIHLVYYGNERRLEYDFEVTPGADPASIEMEIGTGWKASVTKDGDLLVETAAGVAVRFDKPISYQRAADGSRTMVESAYALHDSSRFGFRVGAYDRSKALIIDPVVAYGTYLGGVSADTGNGVAVDAGGNAYVTGWTQSINFPTTAGAFLRNCVTGNVNNGVTCESTFAVGQGQSSTAVAYAFVTKFNPQGTQVLYSTYLGGSIDFGTGLPNYAGTFAQAIAVDAAGNAYITGSTQSPTFPVTANAAQSTRTPILQTTWPGFCAPPTLRYDNPNPDAFVTKLDPTGSSLVYSTYLGSSQNDVGSGIAINTAGEMYIVGSTNGSNSYSYNFTGCSFDAGKYQNFGLTGAGGQPDQDSSVVRGFIIKLSAAGAVVHSDYIGVYYNPGPHDPTLPHPHTYAAGIKLDSSGAMYIAGSTRDPRFGNGCTGCVIDPVGGSPPPNSNDLNYQDAYILKFNPDFSQSYVRVFGGAQGNESATDIALDGHGNAYVAGNSDRQAYPTQAAGNFPTTPGAYQTVRPPSLSLCGFVTKFGPTGAIVYSTLLCNPSQVVYKPQTAQAIAVDPATSTVVVTGNAYDGIPLVNSVAFNAPTGNGAYAVRFNATLSTLLFSSFLSPSGGQNDQSSSGSGIVLDSQLNAYIAGDSGVATGTLASVGAYDTTPNGDRDAFLVKVNLTLPTVPVTIQTNPAGLQVIIDGGPPVTTPQTLNWSAGSLHTIAAASLQAGGAGTQYAFLNWSDGGALSHEVAPTAGITYTATFKTQYQLTMNAGAGGVVAPPSGFFDAGSSVNISATPNSGLIFFSWAGTGSGSFSGLNASTSVTMSGPITETATFAAIGTFTARVNAGGGVYNDPQGILWSPDPNIANTFTFLTQNPIRNTNRAYLYQSERFSLGTPFQYTFPSVSNGAYNVRLLFAETYFTQPNLRKFNVNINGAAALTNFDIVAAAGGSNTAIDTLHAINVTNGQIVIQLVPVLSNPKISAIEITPLGTAVAIAPAISDSLASGATQQFTPTVIGNANTAVTYSLSPNIGNISPSGLYTAPSVANPTKVILTVTSQADNTKSATATIQLVPQAWTTQDIGSPSVPGTSTYASNAFNLQGAGDLLGTADAFRFTFNKLTGDGSITARVNQPFTGATSNKSGVMMRNDLTPGSTYADTSLYSSIVGLMHWRATASGATNAQFGAAGVPWVRLVRTGNTIASYVSNDATAWIPVGSPQTFPAPGINVGLRASNGYSSVLDTVTFDNIELSTSPVAVSINEGLSSLAANQQAQFTANVTGTANTAVTWSITPAGQGSINAGTGLYTAPSTLNPSPQTVTITATSQADPSKSASIIVTLGAFQPIRVNAGGPSHYDPTGTFWFGDTGAVGGQGNVYSAGNSIANTLTPYLYQSERFMANATLTYKYFVPNGSYNVTLKFAEIYFTTTGNRVMNVAINGTTLLSNFDIVAQGGANTAVDRSFPVTVTNGAISISLAPAVSGHAPKISAIQIQ